mmetsp:Transcript_33528/g.88509  ORF Transcript_33528/g.88509 Transcript_33528/m.88509 type:complete len:212 (+) Transcript_33528:43-678(+)
MHKSKLPLWCTMRRMHLEISWCCLQSWSILGLSTNFRDFVRQFGRLAVTLNRASRSWALSPIEITFFLLRAHPSEEARSRPTSWPKAESFHSKGARTPGRSYCERADNNLTLSNTGETAGKNRAQLSSIQPRSALVTSTTVPSCFASRSVSPTRPASARSAARSASEIASAGPEPPPPSMRSARSCTHELGSIVSSQSKITTVSSGSKRCP